MARPKHYRNRKVRAQKKNDEAKLHIAQFVIKQRKETLGEKVQVARDTI